MDIIDTHTHVISPDTARYPVDPLGGRQSEWSRAHPADIDGLVAALDRAGIAKAVVVQASTVYGHDNRYVLEAVRAHPDRFAGVYSIDAVERIRYWQGQGLSGFRLFTTGTTMPGQGDWLGHEDSYPAWAHAEAHDIPVCLQMTIQGLPALRRLLQRFPGVRALLDHCARPDLSDGRPYHAARELFELAEFPGVHLKLTHRALAASAKGCAGRSRSSSKPAWHRGCCPESLTSTRCSSPHWKCWAAKGTEPPHWARTGNSTEKPEDDERNHLHGRPRAPPQALLQGPHGPGPRRCRRGCARRDARALDRYSGESRRPE